MQKLLCGLFLAAAVAAAAGSGAFAADAAPGDATSTLPAAPKNPPVISVKQALTQPGDFKDQRVILSGEFMGYSGTCPSPKPGGSTDIMVQDNKGLCIWVVGPIPDGYDADSNTGYGKDIALSGLVVKPEKGRPYFNIPPTGKAGNKRTSPIAKLYQSTTKSKKTKMVSIEEVLTTPDKFLNSPIAVTGSFMADKGTCAAPPPLMEGVSSWWMMQGSDKRCLWVGGQKPAGPKGDPVAQGDIVNIPGTVKKIGDRFALIAAAAPPNPEKDQKK